MYILCKYSGYFTDYTTIYEMFIFSYWLNPPNPKSTLPQLAKRQEAEKRIGATRATELTSWQLTVKMAWKPRTTRTWHMKRNHGRSEAWRF